MSKIAIEITNRLNKRKEEFCTFYNSGNAWQTDWTKLLKTIITKIGHEKDYFVSTGGLKGIADEGEWLYDLVWSKLNHSGEKQQ
ncbi:hypothetical protein [Aquimarina rhabdastrellae]